jgi:hypothetical protein
MTPSVPMNDDAAPTNAEPAEPVEPDAPQTLDVRMHEVDASIRRFVAERPLVAIAGALAGGFLIGRLLSR